MVDHRARDPVLASHRARGFAVAGTDTSLLVWLAGAGQLRAVAVPEVSHRDTPLLQRDRVHSDDDWNVLPHVSAQGRRSRCVYLLVAARAIAPCGRVIRVSQLQFIDRALCLPRVRGRLHEATPSVDGI